MKLSWAHMINGGRHMGKPHHNRMSMKHKLLTNFLHYYHLLHLHIALLSDPIPTKIILTTNFFWNGTNNTSYRHIDKFAHVKLHTTLALSEHKKHIYLHLSSKPTFNTFVRTNQGVSNKNQKVMKRGGPRYKLLQL